MNIECVNCGLEFAYDPPPFSTQKEARCPRCGHANPADDAGVGGAIAGGGDGLGGDEEVFCFNCGKPMNARADELIPVCDECKAGAGTDTAVGPDTHDEVSDDHGGASVEDAELMVRKANGQVYGPFPEETIIDWIQAGKIQRDEEVSKIGGAWRNFANHEEFASYFPDLKVVPRQTTQDVQFKKVSAARESLGAIGRVLIAVAIIGVVGAGVYYLASRGTLALPDSVLGRASDVIAGGGEQTDVPDEGQLAEHLEELRVRHGVVESPSFEHYYRARTINARGNPADLTVAREEMEKAVVADPDNGAALAGLGELYNKLALVDRASGEFQRKSFYFIDAALEQGEYPLEAWRAKAWFLYVNGEYDDAIRFCEQALSVTDQDAETHVLLGMSRFGQNKSMKEPTLKHFQRALEIAPEFDEVHFQMGRCYEELGQHRAAIDAYSAKIQSDPGYIGAHLALGRLHEAMGDYRKAAAAYEQVLKLDRQNKDAVLRIARIATQVLGDASRAVTYYNALTEEGAPKLSSGEELELALGQASALRLAGNPQAACAAADRALALHDVNHVAYFEKALCQRALDQRGEAMRSLGQAINHASEPQELAVLEFYLGLVHTEDGSGAEAVESFDRALGLDPTLVPAAIFQAGVYASLNQPERVRSALVTIRSQEPNAYRRQGPVQTLWAPVPNMASVCESVREPMSRVNFDPVLFGLAGGVCYHAGQPDRSKSFLARSLEEDPRNWAGLLYSGLLAWEQGDLSRAQKMLTALADEHRDVGVFHLVAGDILLQNGRLEEAAAQYEQALRYDQDLAWAHFQLGVVHAKGDRTDEARNQLQLAMDKDPQLLEPRLAIFEYNI